MSWFSSIADQVTKALPSQEQTNEFLTALTLSTDEMKSERERMEKDERRREELKDALTSTLPWETNVEERGIFVEECREAILSLSSKDSTFRDDTAALRLCRAIQAKQGKVEELENLPTNTEGILPPLLEHFDLNAHVGLIHRLMKEDPNLVLMHAQLSDSVVEEETFWKNYFYSCALTRLEIGLDINEIWGKDIDSLREEAESSNAADASQEASKPLIDVSGFRFPTMSNNTPTPEESEEEEISFSDQSKKADDMQTTSVSLPPLLSPNVTTTKGRDSNSSSPLKDYEMVV